MLNRWTTIKLLAIFLVAAGAIWLAVPAIAPEGNNKPITESEGGPNVDDEINPVSLEALMQKQFDGRDLELDQVLADNEIYTRYYITYKSGDLKISGIMNIPKGTLPDGGWPVLFLNHGHIDTSIYTNGRGLKREQDYFARNGFAVIHSDYRNHAESDNVPDAEDNFRLGYTEDVINAVYAVRAANLPNINTARIGMLGHSMGGGITQNILVVIPNLVKAAVLYAPVSGDYKDNYERYVERRPERLQKFIELYGSLEDNPSFWEGISAANYYYRVVSPVQIHIGTNDESVEESWSYSIRDRLEALGKEVILHEYPGEAHEFGSQWTLFMSRSAEFFNENL